MKNRLKQVRGALGMSQTDLANAIGYNRSYVGGLESGAATFSRRVKATICEKLNVNPVWLETGEGEMFVPPTKDEAEAAHAYLLRRIMALPDDLKMEVLEFCQKLIDRAQSQGESKED